MTRFRAFMVGVGLALVASFAFATTITGFSQTGQGPAAEVMLAVAGDLSGPLRVADKAVQIADVDPALSAALDTGVLTVASFRCVNVAIQNTGSAVSAACVTNMVRDDDSVVPLGATFTVTNGTTSFAASVCPGLVAGTSGYPTVLPRRIQVTCSGVLNANLRGTVVVR